MSNFLNFRGNSGVTFKNHGTGGGSNFALDKSASTNSVLLSIGGIIQKPSTDYAVSGVNITTTSSVTAGVEVFSLIIHDAGNAPVIEDNSIVTSKIADNQVNGAKIAMGSDAQGDVMYYNGTDWARLAAGTDGHFLKTQGTSANPAWAAAGGGGFASMQVFTSSGTWTKPSGIKLIKVYVIGGGGGGAGGSSGPTYGQGGGGGGGAMEVIDVSSVSTVAVTVGAGGAGGNSAVGSAGGTSSFGSYCSATGGDGGIYNSNDTLTDGGSGTGGTINMDGEEGGWADWDQQSGANYQGGDGGDAPFGFGLGGLGGTSAGSSAIQCSDGNGYGSGGGGGQGSTSNNGGEGGGGIVVVEEFK